MRAALVALAGTVNDAGILREACRVLVQAPAGWAAPVSAPAPVPATRVPPAKASKPRKDTATLTPELIDRIKARGEQTSVLAREAGMARSQLAQMLAAPGAKVRKTTLRKLQALAASAASAAPAPALLEQVAARAEVLGFGPEAFAQSTGLDQATATAVLEHRSALNPALSERLTTWLNRPTFQL